MHPETSLRAFLRRFAVAFVTVTLIATAFVAAVTVIENNKFSSIDRIKLPDNVLTPGEAGAPANYLIVGSDTRKGLNSPEEEQAFGPDDHAGLSDVMMVVHLVPSTGSAFVVSFPRDTEVEIPGHGTDKLNAAYAFGGPALLIRTFDEQFKIPIQHYLAVDFKGFEDIANAIGRVKIYFPTAARDFDTGLYQGAGCNALQGDQALAYARSRHYSIPAEGVTHPDPQNEADWVEDPLQDLDRIKRQQYFLRSLGQTALDHGASNIFVANRLADALVGSLTADEDLGNKEIKRLVRTFRGLDPATVEMTTLPVAVDGSDLVPQFPEAQPVLDRLKDLSQPVRLPQLADPADVRVVVVDGSGTDGRAAELSDKLTERGFVDGGEGDASDTDIPKTQVRYAPGHAVEGLTVALYLGTTNVVEATSTTLQFGDETLTGDVIVVVGKDYPKLHGLLASASSSSTTAVGAHGSTSTTSSTTTTTIEVPDTRYVPVATKGLKPLVGCP